MKRLKFLLLTLFCTFACAVFNSCDNGDVDDDNNVSTPAPAASYIGTWSADIDTGLFGIIWHFESTFKSDGTYSEEGYFLDDGEQTSEYSTFGTYSYSEDDNTICITTNVGEEITWSNVTISGDSMSITVDDEEATLTRK